GLGVAAAVLAAKKHDYFSPKKSLETQIQEQRTILGGLDSEIVQYLHGVAVREVEVGNLDKDIKETQQRQVENKKHIQALRDELKSTEVTKVSTKNDSRTRLEKELGRVINAYKRCEEDLKTKEAKLDAYKEALEAAHDELIAYQNERREQEIELARLEAS